MFGVSVPLGMLMYEGKTNTHLFTHQDKTFLLALLPLVFIKTVLCSFKMLYFLVLLSAVSVQAFQKQRQTGRM